MSSRQEKFECVASYFKVSMRFIVLSSNFHQSRIRVNNVSGIQEIVIVASCDISYRRDSASTVMFSFPSRSLGNQVCWNLLFEQMFEALLVSLYDKMVRDKVAMPFFYYKQTSEKFFLVGGQLFMFYEQLIAYISNGMTLLN